MSQGQDAIAVAVLRRLVIEVMGGMEAVHRIAELPVLPKTMQPDSLRELARYIIELEGEA